MIPINAPLIGDFDTFLRYVQRNATLPLTATGELKATDLQALNERVTYPAPPYVTPRSRQADYPLLNFLFQLATSSHLFRRTFDKGTALVPDADRMNTYQGLTREEKYVFLLETAWCYVDWSTLDGDDRSGTGADWFIRDSRQLLKNPVGEPVTLFVRGWVLEGSPALIHIGYRVNAYAWAGHWLGWYDILEMPQEKAKKRELQIDQVMLTNWGKRCLTLLLNQRPFAQWNQQADNYFSLEAEAGKPEKNVDVSTFAGVFRKAFKEPDLVSMYPINKNPQVGELWLRAELPHHKASRTIAMPVSETLEELHLMIQQAFDFGNDHLYCFCMNLRNPYSGKQYFDPRIPAGEADGYPADETTLVSLNLYEGQRFMYQFDFGDNWEFIITVVRHLPDAKKNKARVVEKTGKAPQQYEDGDWQ